MAHLYVGASYRSGQRVPHVRALRRALHIDPSMVIFDTLSTLTGDLLIPANEVNPAHRLTVVGPEPWGGRMWRAIVITCGSKLIVSDAHV